MGYWGFLASIKWVTGGSYSLGYRGFLVSIKWVTGGSYSLGYCSLGYWGFLASIKWVTGGSYSLGYCSLGYWGFLASIKMGYWGPGFLHAYNRRQIEVRVGYRGGAMGAEAPPPLKLMIFISIKMNVKETTYYAKCIQL